MLSKLNPAGTSSSMESAPTYTRYWICTHTEMTERQAQNILWHQFPPITHLLILRTNLGLFKTRILHLNLWWIFTSGLETAFVSILQFYEECTASIWERDEDFQIQRSPSRWSSILWKVKQTSPHITHATTPNNDLQFLCSSCALLSSQLPFTSVFPPPGLSRVWCPDFVCGSHCYFGGLRHSSQDRSFRWRWSPICWQV